ncbi:hypothetical protein M8J75_007653 [Diaphorina citri]|nr:hypothetical protein M8J75_007653 [Diaphorina citri]
MKRVVVTGLGIVSPVGTTRQSAWNAIKEGKSCVSPLSEPEYSKLPCKIAAHIEGLDLTAQFTQSMIDLSDVLSSNNALQRSYNKLSPYFVTRILPNMSAGQISIEHGFQGPNHCVSTACATGAHAIGDAFRLIQGGHADVMIAGAAESCISQLSIAAFCRVRALATQFNNEPAQASRPFDKRRDGFVMGEGSAILVLEELDHALARSANIYAEILGYGMSGDGHHLTSPREDGRGALLAMTRALTDANLSPGDITYINAHATSTPLGDVIELKAIGTLFPAQRLVVSSTKGAHGHLLGAAGNLESAFTILAVHEGLVPPNVNLEDPCEEAGGYECPTAVTEWKTDGRRVALKNSFGFGGTNACLCIAEYKS